MHLLDMRNHGNSDWSDEMDYSSMAHDIYFYLQEAGIIKTEKPVSLVGHSMGGKAAMTFASLFPDLVF